MTNTSESTTNGTSIPFHHFVQDWIVLQQQYLHELLSSLEPDLNNNEPHHRALLGRVVSHYQNHYASKQQAAHQDIFIMFSPPWLISFERTFLWIAGFRPGIMFQLIKQSLSDDLSEQQTQRMDFLKMETKVAEKQLSKRMIKLQESVVGPDFVMARQLEEAQTGHVDAVLETTITDLVGSADYLRRTTVTEILKILSPVQSVRFLAAAAKFHLKVRNWGLQMDGLCTFAT